MEQLVQLFKALSDKNRVRILKMLEARPLCVCEITEILGLAASTTSKHLHILTDAGLSFEQKDGKWVNYHLNRAAQQQYIKQLLPLMREWINDDPVVDQDRRNMQTTDRVDLCRPVRKNNSITRKVNTHELEKSI
ncbi:MAG: metalloregulator ArsR/SmtB family transcription factor [candidate division KSB1 bacterium]|nr:metalloregulator ArsR/SmtB family transcription factor [candidate division KSB1 bacterium]